ncbi:MAG TPA: PIG-L family deacetylase [Acidimicrobiales bacterium]
MATVVFFHAHPDDEAIATGGTMAKLSATGHRVLCVTATKGELGEVDDGFLSEGEELWQRRVEETHDACRALGVHRGEFLGYVDSGMKGEPSNEDPACFWQADLDEAATRLAGILREEDADVLVVYDEIGTYGHPDHVKVHLVGVRAAELAGTPRVYESTYDRDHVRMLMEVGRESGAVDFEGEVPDTATFGMPGERITTRVDVRDFLEAKRAAMAAHKSQIAETSFFLSMPPEIYALTWGTEFYIRRGAPAGTVEDDLVTGL